MNTRVRAAKILASVIQEGRSLEQALQLDGQPYEPRDRALIKEFCYGVCRYYHRLSRVAAELLAKPFKAKDADLESLLQIGFYQLEYTRIPEHAAINETVAGSRVLNKGWASGMINAVLRRFQRERHIIFARLSSDPVFQYSHPSWLLRRLQQTYPNEWQTICEVNNTRAPFTLRVNQHQLAREHYIERLHAEGIEAKALSLSSDAIGLRNPIEVTRLPGFQSGEVSVQDEAAQLAAQLVSAPPGARVLDACSAPGGKGCHILERTPLVSELVALEISPERMKLLEENLSRQGLCATCVIGDATNPESWWDGRLFDRILLDAPCSASGVVRRHPDIKLLRQESDVAKLARHQLRMLQALWPLLKPSGIFVYATCSVLPEENEQIIANFIEMQQDAHNIVIDASWGGARSQGRQLLPEKSGHDGFYYAVLEKTPPQG